MDLYLYYRTYTYFTDTEVPVGTTGLILILQDLYLFYRYGSTRKHYRTCTYFTDTEVLVNTTELVLILPIRKYS